MEQTPTLDLVQARSSAKVPASTKFHMILKSFVQMRRHHGAETDLQKLERKPEHRRKLDGERA